MYRIGFLLIVYSIPLFFNTAQTSTLCNELFAKAKTIDWNTLKNCLAELNNQTFSSNETLNIWRLTKASFNGVENIPADAFKHLGHILVAISPDDLRNITMERVEIVEAFGAIKKSAHESGFSNEQGAIIARKVSSEWLGKGPETYSEFDLISLGYIICHLNISDIQRIHADAFKEAVESIGKLENCSQEHLRAFGLLAKNADAFGEPAQWSKLDMSIVGNIVNGLSDSDIASIDKDKLHLNRHYIARNKTQIATNSTQGNRDGQSVHEDTNNKTEKDGN